VADQLLNYANGTDGTTRKNIRTTDEAQVSILGNWRVNDMTIQAMRETKRRKE
jgi:hypothetical protein